MTAFATAAAGVVRAADDSKVTPGVLGFIVVAAIGVATWLLIRSMNRQMKKIDIPPEGRPTSAEGDEPAEGRSDDDGGQGSAPR